MSDKIDMDAQFDERPRNKPESLRPLPAVYIVIVGISVVLVHMAGFGQVSDWEPDPPLVIDPNDAPLSLLATLPHIGPSLVQKIDETRKRSVIQSEADLDQIPGIGPKILEDLRPYLTYPRMTPTDQATDSPALARKNR